MPVSARVLLVEPSQLFSDLLIYYCSARFQTCAFRSVQSAGAARELTAQLPPDVILIDPNLSGRDGWDLLQDLGSSKRRVVVMAYVWSEYTSYKTRRISLRGAFDKSAMAAVEWIDAMGRVLNGDEYYSESFGERLARFTNRATFGRLLSERDVAFIELAG
ncbi:MAG TPA: response regulator, partial [Candidatus Synoicihabitans sp.]|nr:response regulator [Candidatus Synoicihabitans sp.]